jgi:Fe-S cluster biogenesis protein NfuA
MEQSSAAAEIMIRVLPTPNPNALKFVVNRDIKSEGKATFTRPSEALGVRLAEDLFRIDGVRQLHFFENVVTVTHAEEAEIDTMRLEIQAVLQSRLPIHDAKFLTEEERRKTDRSHLSPELLKIEQILDDAIRMHLQGDGGDIEVVSLSGHNLEVRYQGACGSCPSSISGTLEAIQGVLREQFDPELKVIALE